ncbi:MAG: hypothetical protein K0R71_1452 [Bacillales bacterium]|jgi:uncharacterized membrane protein YcaP (DUF421 family)|nr:hypothetical protein [Bacillales bacterium]
MLFKLLSIELVVGFFLLFFVIKFIGKKLINQFTPFTFVSVVVLGELLGNALYDPKIGVKYIVFSISLWAFLLFCVEYLSLKWLWLRGFIEEKPAVLVKNGVINRDKLKKARMNLNQLQSLLRQNETFSVREVAYCYLESNGTISVIKKSKYQKTTQEDFKLPSKMVYIPVTLIRDGKVLWDEIFDLGFDEKWLKYQLSAHQVDDYKDVFLAEWLEEEGLFVQKYQ